MRNPVVRKWASTLGAVLGIVVFRSALADQYVIPSGSMEPTIQVGDHVWVDKTAYDLRIPLTHIRLMRTHEPERGDVIVFEDPRNPQINLIKRLVGIPGDLVRTVNGRILINGRELPLHGLSAKTIEAKLARDSTPFEYVEVLGKHEHRVQRIPYLARDEDRTFSIPPGQYFFLGDNRDNSADSRVWGFAKRSALLGKARHLLYQVSWKPMGPIAVPDVSLTRFGTEI